MAKPCRYRLPGTDTWLSEADFKKTLNDGLIDKHINDDIISIPGFKPKTETAPVAEAKVEEAKAEPVAEVKAEPTLSKKEQAERSQLDKDISSTTMKIEDLQEEIDIEKSNIQEEKERVKAEKEKIKASKMSKAEKTEKIDELDANLEDYIEDRNATINYNKDELKQEKADLKRKENRKAKLEQKAPVAETKTEAKAEPVVEPKAETKKSAFDENGSFTDSYGIDLTKKLIESAGPRQMSMLARGLRKAGFSVGYSFENRNTTLSQILGDSIDNISYEYRLLSDEEKVEATKILTNLANKLGVEVEAKTETKAEPVKKEKAPKAEAKESYKAKAIDKRGGDKAFTVTVNNSTADVVGEQRPSPMDPTKMTPGASYKGLPITTNINGQRVVETPTGDTIYLDKPIAEKAEETTEVKERVSEGKGANITVDVPGRSVSSPVVKMVKNRRTNQWQALRPDGTTYDPSDTLKDKAEAIYQQTRTGAKVVTLPSLEANTRNRQMVFSNTTDKWMEVNGEGILINVTEPSAKAAEESFNSKNKKLKNLQPTIDEAKAETESLPEDIKEQVDDTLDSEDFSDGVEITEADTTPVTPKKKTGRKAYLASQRRGTAVGFAAGLLEQLERVFPNISRMTGGLVVDQFAFDSVASQLGLNPDTAAVTYDGVIYLNPSQANSNTAFEEYAQVYLMAIQQINPALFNRGMNLLENGAPEYVDEVMNDPGYSYIHGNKKYDDLTASQKNDVRFEALAKMVADRAEKVFEEKRKAPLMTFLKDLWGFLSKVFNRGTTKLELSRSTLDDYIKDMAKQLNKNTPISMLNTDQLNQLANKEGIDNLSIAKNIASPQSKASQWLRSVFFANKGMAENEAYRLKQARRNIEVAQRRMKDTVNDLNKGIKDYVKATGTDKKQALLDVNQSLSDPEFRANWFSSNPDAARFIEPVVKSMRQQIDSLQDQLAKSGLFNDDLVATITNNNDIYVNTAYYAFSGTHKGDWMNLFTEAEANQIITWMYEGSYQTATSMKYNFKPNGEVEIQFVNGLDIESESITLKDLKALKAFLKDNVVMKMNGAPINTRKIQFNTSKGSTDFNGVPMDIQSKGKIKFPFNQGKILQRLNNVAKDKAALISLIHYQKLLTSPGAVSALKKKRNLDDTYKLLLKEIKDPAINFARTIAKQSEILHKGMMEQAIIDSGYLASKSGDKMLNTEVNSPSSRLNGYFIPKELHDFLYNPSPDLFDLVRPSKVKNTGGQGTLGQATTSASSMVKAYLTVLSISSNAANYFSGYFQLAKTGNMPFGMISSMKALEKSFNKMNANIPLVGNGKANIEDITAVFLNTVPTIIRGITKMASNTALLNEGREITVNGQKIKIFGGLTQDQKDYFGVNDYSQLNPAQKSKVLLEELLSVGVINSSIEAEVLKELTEKAFGDEKIPDEVLKSAAAKLWNNIKSGTGKAWDSASASYSFSDSMFKTIMYINEKGKNWNTYGSAMVKEGVDPAEVESQMRERTAIDVRKQMPTYDRSPDLIRAWSKFPLVGSFIQFDFQSKVNDKNILLAAFQMVKDAREMKKKGFDDEASKLNTRALFKLSGFVLSSTASYFMYGLIASMMGYDDDDDEAVRSVMPEYRRFNMLLPLDGKKKGIHQYVDVSRIDPQTLYVKYARALSEEGFDVMADEILKPYLSEDILVGSIYQSVNNIDKFGRYSKILEAKTLAEKLQYAIAERILPSGTYGQVEKVIKALKGDEVSEGITMDVSNELMNMYFGAKIRDVNIGKEYSNKIKYDAFDRITDLHKLELRAAIKEKEKIEGQVSRGVKTQADLNEAIKEVERQRLIANENSDEEIQKARALTNKMIGLGYTEDEIRQLLLDNDATRYLINILLDPSLKPEYDSEGKIQSGKVSSGGGKGEFDLDLNLEL